MPTPTFHDITLAGFQSAPGREAGRCKGLYVVALGVVVSIRARP